jgi:hypothetical protein
MVIDYYLFSSFSFINIARRSTAVIRHEIDPREFRFGKYHGLSRKIETARRFSLFPEKRARGVLNNLENSPVVRGMAIASRSSQRTKIIR